MDESKPELVDELLKGYEKPEDVIGENGLLKRLTKALLERALNAELTHHLGDEKHDPAGHNSGNFRNGVSRKTVKGEFGEIVVDTPRDRNGNGNRTDVSTMETILHMVERKYGKARRIWVFDRGIVSEENLAAIRKPDGQYLTGTPRSQMKQFEAELLKEDWAQVRPEVEIKKAVIPQGEETYILCRTSGRKEKEKAIRDRFSNSMERALKGLEKTIATGRLKDRNKMERRLGKIQARHPQVNDLYDVELQQTAEGARLFWQIKEDRKNWRESRERAYLPRTNLKAETAQQLWSKYMQLTEAEAAFRALKSELSIRPLFHQLEPRVKAHVMVAFLGYALWVTLKHLLKRRPAIAPKPSESGVENAQPMTPMKAIALLSTLQSADIVPPTTDGREIRLRRITSIV